MPPELKIEELKKQSNFMMNQLAQAVEEVKKKGPQELTTEELDSVAGRKSFTGGRNAAFFYITVTSSKPAAYKMDSMILQACFLASSRKPVSRIWADEVS